MQLKKNSNYEQQSNLGIKQTCGLDHFISAIWLCISWKQCWSGESISFGRTTWSCFLLECGPLNQPQLAFLRCSRCCCHSPCCCCCCLWCEPDQCHSPCPKCHNCRPVPVSSVTEWPVECVWHCSVHPVPADIPTVHQPPICHQDHLPLAAHCVGHSTSSRCGLHPSI